MYGDDMQKEKLEEISYVSQEKLKEKRSEICRRLNPEPDLFSRLVARSVLNERQAAKCQAKRGKFSQSFELLNIIQRRPTDNFVKFCEILQDLNQGHIVTEYLLLHCNKPTPPPAALEMAVLQVIKENLAPVHPAWREVLRVKLPSMAEDLNPDDGLITELVALGVIQDYLSDTFEETAGRTSRSVNILLHLSQKCSDDHFLLFLHALHRTQQSHIIDKYFADDTKCVSTPHDVFDGPCSLDHAEIGGGGVWKKTLVRQHSSLVDRMEASDELIRELEACGVLNSRQREILLEKEEKFERGGFLLDHMKRRSDVDFEKFCRILEATDQGHIVTDYLLLGAVPSSPLATKDRESSAVDLVLNSSIEKEEDKELVSSSSDLSSRTDSFNTDVEGESENIAISLEPARSLSSDVSLNLQSLNLQSPNLQSPSAEKADSKTAGPIEILEVNVIKSTQEFYEENKNKSYSLNALCRGRCVIVNINRTAGHSERRGSEVDQRLLTELFSQLHFRVEAHNDLTAEEIRHLMDDLSTDPLLQSDQCLAVFILSHGELVETHTRTSTSSSPGGGGASSPGGGVVSSVVECVYGSDGQLVYNEEDILVKFTDLRCPALQGRPKLFFFQACRGKNYDQCDSARCSVDSQSPSSFADFLILHPTHSYFRAFRNTEYGSWYVNAIVRVFMRNAHNTGVCAMMNMVNGLVSTWRSRSEDEESSGRTQVAEFSSKLRKADVYFFPGIIVDESAASNI